MNDLTVVRTEFLDFLDNADIFSHLQLKCQKKGLNLPSQVAECQLLYETSQAEFEQKINQGIQTQLPTDNVWIMVLQGLRHNIPMEQMSFQKLDVIIEFDAEENLGVKYIVDESESIESWVQRHAEFQIDSVRGVFDSYLLEFFETQGLELRDNKLYRKNTQTLVTQEDFRRDEQLGAFASLKASVMKSKWTQSVEVNTLSTKFSEIEPDSQPSAL